MSIWNFWKPKPRKDQWGVLRENRYADTPVAPAEYPKCDCFDSFYRWERRFDSAESQEERAELENSPFQWSESKLHVDPPFRSKRAWDIACDIIDVATHKARRELNLGKEMDRVDYMALNTLPATIGDLKNLRKLVLYGSNISSLPREIAGCENLQYLEPYTSYRLHWFPYELTRCKNLTFSCVSTRALYGNYKLRPPFPDLSLSNWRWPNGNSRCSICNSPANDLEQFWISKRVGTDVMPLLVSVCGSDCLHHVGPGEANYVHTPHTGGLRIKQPPASWI